MTTGKSAERPARIQPHCGRIDKLSKDILSKFETALPIAPTI
jgi:hypothetical protein